jgi:hypothetical protein
MHQAKPPGIFLDQRKRRTADFRWFGLQALRQAANQGGLSRPKVAEQCEDVTSLCSLSEALPQPLGMAG